jgi:hypothetical protein
LVDHDVDRASAGRVEVHLTITVERVEPPIRLAPGPLEVGHNLLATFGKTAKIDVLIAPKPWRKVGAQYADRQASEEPQRDAFSGSALHQLSSFNERIVRRPDDI